MTIVDVAQSDGQSEINAVVDVSADVEVILTYITFVGTVECIARSGIVEPHVLICVIVQVAGVDVVELVARHIGITEIRHTICIGREEQAVLLLCIREFVLRCIVQTIGSRENVVEVTALVVVEAEVQIRVHS